MWLQVSYTNHLPGMIAGYMLNTVSAVGGYPLHIRTDCGTENGTVAAIQSLVTGSTSSHTYGTSPGNQRIEAWWSFFRRSRSQWWIELFEDLVQFGAFHPGCIVETEILRFCFMGVLQSDLDDVRRRWNTHRIRPSAGARCPAGIPDELYYLPESPATNCLILDCRPLPAQVIDQILQSRSCEDAEYEEYLNYLCSFHNWSLPVTDVDQATDLYLMLVHVVQS